MSDLDHQAPVDEHVAQSYAEMLAIVTHPAFRLGFLDALDGRGIEHDAIMRRIVEETPPRALDRIQWYWPAGAAEEPRDLWGRRTEGRKHAAELAQYRYEEGRLLAVMFGLKCRAWGHPDYPPKAVLDYILEVAA